MKLNFISSIIVLFLMIIIFTLVSCATHPKKIGAAYVSPYKYKDYDCDQLEFEMDNVSQRTVILYHSLKKEADTDKAQGWIGALLFWPALLLLEGETFLLIYFLNVKRDLFLFLDCYFLFLIFWDPSLYLIL